MSLEAHRIGFRYGQEPWILRGFDFDLHPGEVVGLAGPSGCGKSTLGQLLAGYRQPLEGSVTLDDASVSSSGYRPAQLVFQHPEKAVNPRWMMAKTLREGWEPGKEVLAALGVEPDWLNRWPHELSGGELQRFCIARALGPATRYLIADEMTTMLDAITQAQLWHAVLDIAAQRGMGMLIISHDRHLLERLCSRIVDAAAFMPLSSANESV
ncbi:ABC transporter ATP-binding protein [Paenibacillus piri]|uniref:ATP-binding cassette domain-containing protein n=1 Tax=Paenibacillus piri TaxID=2547395 RepID=A0A4R5KLK3_9BACL|nr:ATP-binding cassette domain-containing protein [Paenibacillus piri]TDF95765.1 ATP-binding cassette domain-containing protein [Paenibacillus piri]